jgi:hypothetical protein
MSSRVEKIDAWSEDEDEYVDKGEGQDSDRRGGVVERRVYGS